MRPDVTPASSNTTCAGNSTRLSTSLESPSRWPNARRGQLCEGHNLVPAKTGFHRGEILQRIHLRKNFSMWVSELRTPTSSQVKRAFPMDPPPTSATASQWVQACPQHALFGYSSTGTRESQQSAAAKPIASSTRIDRCPFQDSRLRFRQPPRRQY